MLLVMTVELFVKKSLSIWRSMIEMVVDVAKRDAGCNHSSRGPNAIAAVADQGQGKSNNDNLSNSKKQGNFP